MRIIGDVELEFSISSTAYSSRYLLKNAKLIISGIGAGCKALTLANVVSLPVPMSHQYAIIFLSWCSDFKHDELRTPTSIATVLGNVGR